MKRKVKDHLALTYEEHVKHQMWCNRNEIFIYFQPTTWREGNIVIERKGIKEVSEESYNQIKLKVRDKKWWDIVPKLYTKIYIEENG